MTTTATPYTDTLPIVERLAGAETGDQLDGDPHCAPIKVAPRGKERVTPASGAAMVTTEIAQALAGLERARALIDESDSTLELRNIAATAAAAAAWAKRTKAGVIVENAAAEVRLRAERRTGELFDALDRGHGNRHGSKDSPYKSALVEAGSTRNDAREWRKLSNLAADDFEQRVSSVRDSGKLLTKAALLSASLVDGFDGDEYGTPSYILDMVRELMGGKIDLDPASNARAQETVQAKNWYTKADDGLSAAWMGDIWLNPPYSKGLVERAMLKFASYQLGRGVALVNASTDTGWFHTLLAECDVSLLVKGRISFVGADGEPEKGNRYAQAMFFKGFDRTQVIEACFDNLGTII